MKKFISVLFVGLIASMCFWSCSDDDDDDEVVIDSNSLPHTANLFLKTYFAGDEPSLITKETDSDGGYDVTLNSGIEVEFDARGYWTEVEATQAMEIPNQDFIPEKIRQYVEEHYGKYDFGINTISREKGGYKVMIVTLLTLFFDSQGNFVERLS